jgi:NADH-quinone oxidoreductase subunit A
VAYDFANVLVFTLVSILFVAAMIGVGALVRPRIPNKDKSEIYECGEVPIGRAWFNFNPRFYVVALVFVIFEVEVALMLPVALVYKKMVGMQLGAFVFFEILAFLLILSVGLAWIWVRGDLDWLKRLVTPDSKKDATR